MRKEPRLCAPLTAKEVFDLRLAENESMGVVLVVTRIKDTKREFMLEMKSNEKIKFLGSSFRKGQDGDILETARRILREERGFSFEPKISDIFFAGKFTTSEEESIDPKSNVEKFHYKAFILVEDYRINLLATRPIVVEWKTLEEAETFLPKVQKFCLQSLKHEIESKKIL